MTDETNPETGRTNQPPEGFDYTMCFPAAFALSHGPAGDALMDSEVFQSRESAEAACVRRNAICGRHESSRYFLRVTEITWRLREALTSREAPVWCSARFWNTDGARAIHADHFVSMAETDKTLLSYVQSNIKGSRNLRTPIKPGRYLTKYFGKVLTESQIKFYADWQTTGAYPRNFSDSARYPLAFAATPDEIEEVYVTGPRSCMSAEGREYVSECHPVRVYGAGDLAVAYIYGEEEGKPIARALVWPERKTVGRIYPTGHCWGVDGFDNMQHSGSAANELLNRLKAEGYSTLSETPDGFDGARLLRIEHDDAHVVMPYLDNGYMFDTSGDWDGCTMTRRGGYPADDTNGLALLTPEYESFCENCGGETNDDNEVFTLWTASRGSHGEQLWCNHCVENDAFRCSGVGEVFAHAAGTELENGDTVVASWAEGNCYMSDNDGEYYPNYIPSTTLHNGEVWTSVQFAVDGFTCRVTGNRMSKDDMHPDHVNVSADVDQEALDAFLAHPEVEEAA